MADQNQLSILLVTDNKDYTDSIGEVIRSHYPRFHLAHNEQDVLITLKKEPIDVMILGFETVQENEVFYLHLLRADRTIDQRVSYIMLFAIKEDVQTAFDSCNKNIFDDYYIACPLYDINYILIRLREIERLLVATEKSDTINLPLDEVEAYLEHMLSSGQRLGVLNEETEQRIHQTLHDAMDRLREKLLQQGGDPSMLKLIDEQKDVSRSSKLDQNPQLYESRRLIKEIVEETSQQQKHFSKEARTRNRTRTSDENLIANHLLSDPSDPEEPLSLAEQLAADKKQARMDKISHNNLQPHHGVLIIEDELGQLRDINETLARQGLVTYPVQTGTEAIENLEDWQPALVLIDLTLPDISALSVIAHIKEHPSLRNIRIVALANKNERNIVLEAAKAGIKQVVLKPVDHKLLTQRVQNNLEAIAQTWHI